MSTVYSLGEVDVEDNGQKDRLLHRMKMRLTKTQENQHITLLQEFRYCYFMHSQCNV